MYEVRIGEILVKFSILIYKTNLLQYRLNKLDFLTKDNLLKFIVLLKKNKIKCLLKKKQ